MTNDLRCSHCDKEFKYESEKKRHILSHSRHFKCGVCNKKFSFHSALKRHEKQHQRTDRVKCKQCSRSFRDDSLLKRHIKYAHEGKYACFKCNAEFHSEVALNIHEKIHKPKSERKYHCGYDGCEKTFNFPHHLKHHEMTHTDTKQHYCYICKKGFIQLHHLKAHIKTHEPEKWLHCTEIGCKKTFPTEYSMKRHLFRVHNIKFDDISSAVSAQAETDFKYDVEYDTVLCTTCGQILNTSVYEEHKSKCVMSCNGYSGGLNTAKQSEQLAQIINDDNSLHMNDCKSILGSCIVSGNSSEKCLCAQIKKAVADYYDDNTTSDEKENSHNKTSILQSCEPYKSSVNESINTGCESCACNDNFQYNLGSTNDISLSTSQPEIENRNCYKQNMNVNLPDIEYKPDGSIKLRDTFDTDIKIFEKAHKEEIFDTENKDNKKTDNSYYVPFNSCKAVLGKCIVSGNGTISEECLCAKMLADEQQVTPEEIDEITPHPIVTSVNLSVI